MGTIVELAKELFPAELVQRVVSEELDLSALLDGGLTYLERKGQYGATSAAIDGVTHTGTALGSIYVGAVVGNAIPIPVVGTIAGAVAGYFVGGIANTL